MEMANRKKLVDVYTSVFISKKGAASITYHSLPSTVSYIGIMNRFFCSRNIIED